MNSTFVYLTGGLGNQLFQVAAALNNREINGGKVILDTSLGRPRTTEEKADVLHLKLPAEVSLFSRDASVLSQKAAGFLLRMGINPTPFEQNMLINLILRSLGQLIFSLRYKKSTSIEISKNVGFSELDRKANTLLLGYFQSYKYLQNPTVRREIDQVSPKEKTDRLERFINEAKEQKPIFVHVRLGDYLDEEHFGTPSKSYYYNSLIRLEGQERKIWVFSDDITLAKKRMPSEFNSQYFYVDDSGLSPAQLLQLLRHGEDYVIANSSFSWWGAALSLKKDSKVIAPEPWFAGMPEPKDLIPPHWYREKAYL